MKIYKSCYSKLRISLPWLSGLNSLKILTIFSLSPTTKVHMLCQAIT
ncbi:hypothetical protein J4449_04490 [Candidatus Woesearchaeota archaeon]|nr:hypothetical protein [Candidatus Woesearchaeota archaeon]